MADEDEDIFLLKIAGKPVDQRLKQSYLNIFNNETATDEKITLLLDLVNHQATATAPRQANSDYLDLFYLNFETAANLSNPQTLVDILKSADSAKRTLYINSFELNLPKKVKFLRRNCCPDRLHLQQERSRAY